MQIELTAEQKEIKTQLRVFLEKEIIPFAHQYEQKKMPVPREFIKKLIPFGYIGGMLPQEYGGHGMDLVTYLTMIEELSRAWPSLRIMIAGTNLVTTYIYRYGNEEQKQRLIPKLMSGEQVAFFALSEPNVGSDAASIETTAEMVGGTWVLNGIKSFVACGLDGDLGLAFASNDRSKGAKGITAFILEKGVSEYLTRPVSKMGTHSATMAELTFKDTRIPIHNQLGEMGKGYGLALAFLNIVRSAVPFVCAGVAQACIDASISFAKKRQQFGKPIGSFQMIQTKIADMITNTEAMRLLGYQAAYLVDKGLPCQREVSAAKLFASEAVLKVAENAMQIHGAYGYISDFPIERYYRDIRYFTVADGTSEMHRLIIGRDALGISAFN